MKKDVIYKVVITLVVILILCFSIAVGYDYYKYDPIVTSAPFYVNIIYRFVEFLVPAIIIKIIGYVIRKRKNK